MASIADGTPSVANPTNALILPNILYPVLDQLDRDGYKDIQTDLRRTLFQLEEIYPGFSRTFLQSFIHQELPSLSSTSNLNELTLRWKNIVINPLITSHHHVVKANSRIESSCQNSQTNSQSNSDDINEKREFLETIKEIASAIKKTLDSVLNTYQYFKTAEGRQALESEKKEFIKYSKHFSNTLKAYFRDNKRDDVYVAANYLLIQTDYLLRTIKLFCEPDTLDESLYPSLIQHQNQMKTNVSSRSAVKSTSLRPSSTYETNYS